EGKRVAKTVGGTTARYFYEYDNVVFEYTNSGAISAFNVIGTNLISRETGTDKVYYFYNGHADVTALLDATTKSIRSQYKYDEFGNITSETYYDSTGVETIDENEIIKSQILYAGYQYDEESKYYNLQARYYDPQTARFLQQGTYMGAIADPLSLNLYAYCHNEPMMYVDPTGYTGEKSALTLVNEIIAAKKGWEESQLKINEYYEEEDSDIDVKAEIANKYKYASNAATAREMLKDTDAYKNDAYFREACNAYLKKAYGGTMSDVKQLQSMLSTLMYRQAPPPPPSKGTGNSELTEEQILMIKTVYGEAANCSEASWEAVANVIMNRVGTREWKKYDTVTKVIKNSGFDAYTNPNDPYKTAEKYLNNRDGSNAKLEKLISIVLDVYNGKSEDNTNGAVLYYSPKAQAALHKKFPKSYPSLVPPWVNDKVQEVKVSGAEKDDFKFYRYK
ncbi:RHS repeat-associated core domain-containing protein, partial [Acetivibrio cellulolyticus]|uniref:RHS repeat-associated core domain-containing protein n=1 Tax=Acetivibrio cellulolyticus TaxID=35830 RepID=UPI0002481AB2